MSTVAATKGLVKVGATPATIAKVTSFALTIEGGVLIEDTSLGDEWKSYIVDSAENQAPKGWTASLECHLDAADTAGQGALVAGAQVAIDFFPDGSTGFGGNAIVTNVNYNNASTDAAVSFTVQVTGNGALS